MSRKTFVSVHYPAGSGVIERATFANGPFFFAYFTSKKSGETYRETFVKMRAARFWVRRMALDFGRINWAPR